MRLATTKRVILSLQEYQIYFYLTISHIYLKSAVIISYDSDEQLTEKTCCVSTYSEMLEMYY